MYGYISGIENKSKSARIVCETDTHWTGVWSTEIKNSIQVSCYIVVCFKSKYLTILQNSTNNESHSINYNFLMFFI